MTLRDPLNKQKCHSGVFNLPITTTLVVILGKQNLRHRQVVYGKCGRISDETKV